MRTIRHVLVWACGILAIAVAAAGVHSFWHCDEAGYYSWKPLAGTEGLDIRRIIGSYRGGLFWVSTQTDVQGNVDWYGGPPAEMISDHGEGPILVTESVSGMKSPFDPAGHWRRGGFGFAAEGGKSRDGKTPTWQRGLVVPDWLVFLLLAWLPTMSLRRRWILRKRRRKGLCLFCGYDLRAATSATCPECGQSAPEQRRTGASKRRLHRRWVVAAALALCIAIGLAWGIYAWAKPKIVRLTPGMPLAADHLPSRVELEIAPGVSMQFALIPAGHFMMGSPPTEEGRSDNELQHKVFISKPFYMAVTPVTQEQYQAVVGSNPSLFKGQKRPVESVPWDEAVEFCRKMAAKSRRKIHLPTEAQWEYACRAGAGTPFNTGQTLPRESANYATYASSYPNNRHVSREQGTVPVGTFRPNGWGLYDMHGNIWQWCSDIYGDYRVSKVRDPTGASVGQARVLRGGSWGSGPQDCRCAYRGWNVPGLRNNNIGFRVCLPLDSE